MKNVIELQPNEWIEYSWGSALEHKVSGKCVLIEVDGQEYDMTNLPFAVETSKEGFSICDKEPVLILSIEELQKRKDCRLLQNKDDIALTWGL